MKRVRIIPRLDVKGPNVVKGIQLEGLRVVGKPSLLAKKYYDQGADEILYIDIVASLYERNNLRDIVEETTSSGVYIPMAVGGGIRSIEDVRELLRAGADKVAINTAATRRPQIISETARVFGSQCIVGSIEAKYRGEGKWEAYVDNGRERTGLDAVEWAKKLVDLGAGELLITSVDRDGTRKGYDEELIKKIAGSVSVPVIACGGAGSVPDVCNCLERTKCDAIAFGTILHYGDTRIDLVKTELEKRHVSIRPAEEKRKETHSVHSNKTVSIVDYGAGNLRSVINAFKSIGINVKVISSGDDVLGAEILVLPGDGAFAYAMKELKARGLEEPIKEYARSGKPLLGICLGMQLLMSKSEEFGTTKGLGLIDGEVTQIRPVKNSEEYRIPHMGWNALVRPEGIGWEGTILDGTPNDALAYFIHSFCVIPKNKKESLANTMYGGQEFCTVIMKGNILGTQFHPEKSGEPGMGILRNLCKL